MGGTEGFDFFDVWATMLANEALLTTLLIPLTLALLERLARISMFPTWPPVPSARCRRFLKVCVRSVGRVPQSSTLEPLHLRIGMALLEAAKRW